jgi:UDP-N-acetylmuramate-alanine ligase
MKNLIILCAVAVWLMTACTADKTRTFIPGTYVNAAQGEFSIANDTLVIEATESNNYLIHRKTGFNIITDGKKSKREYETEEWQAIYDEATKSLTETRKGKLITFYPEANKLMVGKREYKKIN